MAAFIVSHIVPASIGGSHALVRSTALPASSLGVQVENRSSLENAILRVSCSRLLAWGSMAGLLVTALSRRALLRASRASTGSQRRFIAAAGVESSTATTTQVDYEALTAKLKEVSHLEGIEGLLGWDEMTMMPSGASASRAAQKEALAGVLHAKRTDVETGTLLERLSGATTLDPHQLATVREASREYKKATSLPDELVKRLAVLQSRGYEAWVKARQAKDWSMFAPVLREILEARREQAALIGPGKPPYDVLVDDYSAGLTAARIDEIFSAAREGLVPLLSEIRSKGTAPDASWLSGSFDVAKQADLCKDVALALGFDLEKGRLDVSVHPFTGGAHPTDVRMTTRFKENDVIEGLSGAIHETGHALYEQGRNSKYDGLPVGAAAGMAIHESQSLLWERMVGLSRPFAAYLLPKLKASFPDALPEEKSSEDLYAALNCVKETSMIRVEADEVTYPMHIILRFEIEKALVEGELDVDDVPKVWNQKMKDYLGAEPEDDAQGCLQDVHWSAGLAGYFPTYTLGAMAAVQIFQTAKSALPELDDQISSGDFAPLREWLRERIHEVGSLYPTADDLLVAVTGRPLDPSIFIQYLREKYMELYKLSA